MQLQCLPKNTFLISSIAVQVPCKGNDQKEYEIKQNSSSKGLLKDLLTAPVRMPVMMGDGQL